MILLGCKTVQELSSLLGHTYDEVANLIYPETKQNYIQFQIPKKNGKTRQITAPKRDLKELQRKLVPLLEELYTPRVSAFGFIKNRSICSNAEPHVAKKYVFNIDLQNFFESITFGRLRRLFMSRQFELSSQVATVIAQICCNNNSLPQGAPTSPVISNIICYKLDGQLQYLAKLNNCTYTRYVDDITFSFSCRKASLPGDIIQIQGETTLIGQALRSYIESNGFRVNDSKTRLQGYFNRQVVTGLIVNKRINVNRKFINKTNCMLYAWEKFGAPSAGARHFGNKNDINEKKLTGYFINRVRGRIAFIRMVRGKSDQLALRMLDKYKYLSNKHSTDSLHTEEHHISLLTDNTFSILNNITSEYGTGFYVEGVGIITNRHVLKRIDYSNADTLTVMLPKTNKEYPVKLIAHHPIFDCSLLQFQNESAPSRGLTIRNDTILNIGNKVILAGYPNYKNNDSIYLARAIKVQFSNFYEHPAYMIDTPIIHGNSGGPILNLRYEIVEIATFGRAIPEQRDAFYGFIPISLLSEWITSITQKAP